MSAPFQIIEIGFSLLVNASVLGDEVEKSVRSAGSHEDKLIIHLHDFEEDMLPYLDRSAFHGRDRE